MIFIGDDMKNDDFEWVAKAVEQWTIFCLLFELRFLCSKSDLQPNSCWFQFFSFSRAQGGLEVYYGHICPGNSTKNSIFVSFHQFLKQFPMILETLRRDWISHACYSFRKFWKTQHIIGSSVLTAQYAYLTQDNRFPSCLHFICNRI